MMRTAIILALGALCASPAAATEWVSCASPGGEASFDYLAGSLDVLAISGLNVSVGEQVWASDVAYGPGDPIAVGQAFEDSETVRVDVLDQEMTTRVAELRLFKAQEGESDPVLSGTLRIPGHGAWPVACTPG
ncbi:MAG TPA: hypothetical protein VFE52_11315 [Devosia sp.]|jgi:hypothetical protein|nr:hypothetical protein [Devosia sp.]